VQRGSGEQAACMATVLSKNGCQLLSSALIYQLMLHAPAPTTQQCC